MPMDPLRSVQSPDPWRMGMYTELGVRLLVNEAVLLHGCRAVSSTQLGRCVGR